MEGYYGPPDKPAPLGCRIVTLVCAAFVFIPLVFLMVGLSHVNRPAPLPNTPIARVPPLAVPYYPGARLVVTGEKDGFRSKSIYSTSDDPDTVTGYYRMELPKYGWIRDEGTEYPGMMHYGLVAAGKRLYNYLDVAVTKDTGPTYISVTIWFIRPE